MKKIAILTSGGDAPGMNAAIRAIALEAFQNNVEVYGIIDGFKGLVNDNIIKLTKKDVIDIISKGGTILGSARLDSFKEESVRIEAFNNLQKYGIDTLFVIGGNGTYMGALKLSQLGVRVVGLPGTIDNDIESTDYSIGFFTSCNTIVDCIEKLRDTSSSHHRLALVEAMGRYCGDLSMRSALASGADAVYTREHPFDKAELVKLINQKYAEGAKSVVVVIAEHLLDINALAKELDSETPYEARATVLGHLQRGGSPVVEDRVNATLMGSVAYNSAKDNPNPFVVGIKNGSVVTIPMEEALNMDKNSNNDFYELVKRLN